MGSDAGQIAVAGNEAPGRPFAETLSKRESCYEILTALPSDARLAAIHCELRPQARVMPLWTGETPQSQAAALSYFVLRAHGRPKAYFPDRAAIPKERWRIKVVRGDLTSIKNKGARHLLIQLHLVKRVIAFDVALLKCCSMAVSIP